MYGKNITFLLLCSFASIKKTSNIFFQWLYIRRHKISLFDLFQLSLSVCQQLFYSSEIEHHHGLVHFLKCFLSGFPMTLHSSLIGKAKLKTIKVTGVLILGFILTWCPYQINCLWYYFIHL